MQKRALAWGRSGRGRAGGAAVHSQVRMCAVRSVRFATCSCIAQAMARCAAGRQVVFSGDPSVCGAVARACVRARGVPGRRWSRDACRCAVVR